MNMSETERLAALKRLRRPFPDEAVRLKPVYTGEREPDGRGGNRIPDGAYGLCGVCGKEHAHPSKHLRYIGHARITERLNDVDPLWSWEPMATDAEGLPLVRGGCLWIRLTVCGVTRIGVGDAGGKTGANAMKEIVGDAIRNAAMRFGCGIEMWFGQEDEETGPLPADGPDDGGDGEVIEI